MQTNHRWTRQSQWLEEGNPGKGNPDNEESAKSSVVVVVVVVALWGDEFGAISFLNNEAFCVIEDGAMQLPDALVE